MGFMDNCCTFKFEIFSIVFLGSNFFVDTLLAQFLTLNGMGGGGGGVHPLEVSSNVPKPLTLESSNFFTFDTYLWVIVCTTFY